MRQYLNPFTIGITSGVLLSKSWPKLRQVAGPTAEKALATGKNLADKVRPKLSRTLDGLNTEISADLPPADGSSEATGAQARHLLSQMVLGAGVVAGALVYAKYGPAEHRKPLGASAGMLAGQQMGALAGLLGAGPAGMLLGGMTGGVAGSILGTDLAQSRDHNQGTRNE